jgi:hypothetical protein
MSVAGPHATGALRLTEPQRRAIGVRLRAVREAVATLRRAGLDHERLDAIEELASRLADAAQIPPPLPQPSLVAAAIAEILVDSAELRPSSMRRYGRLDDATAQTLQEISTRLGALADALVPPAVDRRA